eukprot:11977544-Alexandrium_andersonii.AAC.1
MAVLILQSQPEILGWPHAVVAQDHFFPQAYALSRSITFAYGVWSAALELLLMCRNGLSWQDSGLVRGQHWRVEWQPVVFSMPLA